MNKPPHATMTTGDPPHTELSHRTGIALKVGSPRWTGIGPSCSSWLRPHPALVRHRGHVPTTIVCSCAVCSFAIIDEVKNSDALTDVNDSIEDVNDFLVTTSSAVVVKSLDFSSAEINDREIKI